jgi:inosine-uridine nucleoside N-ribohydrolase
LAHQNAHDLTIVALGPLTNIALALRKSPALKQEVSEIIVMGGSTAGGNESAAAEFNFFVDPDAARIVFESGIPITMVGLNATRQTMLERKHVQALQASGSCVGALVAKLGDFYLKTADGFALHDPLALAMAIDKTLASATVPMRIDIDARDGLTNGASIYNSTLSRPRVVREGDHFTDAGEEPVAANAEVPTVIASERFLALLLSRLGAADGGC